VSIKKVVACIKKYNKFLITAHTNPEGDALGSELAIYRLLKKLGKSATIVNEDETPYSYDFLPGKNNIKKFRKNIKGITFDCFVVLDCSDLKRTGEVYKINIDHKPILNIDHHISNQHFGDVNWVDPKACSCSEMIYQLYKRLCIPLDKDIAELLYVGIHTDTGSFRYPNTVSLTHKIVSGLLEYSLNIPQIYKNIYENIPFEDMRLLSRILVNMKRQAKGKVISFQIQRDVLKNKKSSFDLTEHILTFGRSIKDVEVVLIFKENLGERNEVRVNLRSQGKVDVNKIAAFFGGGGHKTASGCTIKGKIKHVERIVLNKIKEFLK
jgi:phosphoesterase RecJ-like protein